jgi:hypothetical protein
MSDRRNIANDATVFPHSDKLFFPVEERILRVDGDGPVMSHKAVVRTDGDSPTTLGIVGKDYQIVDNRDLFGKVEQQLADGLPADILRSAQVKDSTSNGGAFCARDYRFPDAKCRIEGRNGHRTDVAFRTVLTNSHDGSGSAKLYTGAIDFYCSNGMIVGDYDVFGRKHTKNFDVSKFADKVAMALSKFWVEAERLQDWAKRDVSEEKVHEALQNLPGVSERKAERLFAHFQEQEAPVRGSTVYAVYSALTWYASHPEDDRFKVRNTGNDNEAETLMRREDEVRRWVRSEPFQSILLDAA